MVNKNRKFLFEITPSHNFYNLKLIEKIAQVGDWFCLKFMS
jgi:hypothetical protein